MEIILTPGDLQNDNYRLNIPVAFRESVMEAFADQHIVLVLEHERVIEIPNNNATYLNQHAFSHAHISEWLHEIQVVPYPQGHPPHLPFWLVETPLGSFLIHNQ